MILKWKYFFPSPLHENNKITFNIIHSCCARSVSIKWWWWSTFNIQFPRIIFKKESNIILWMLNSTIHLTTIAILCLKCCWCAFRHHLQFHFYKWYGLRKIAAIIWNEIALFHLNWFLEGKGVKSFAIRRGNLLLIFLK
jgi:hypothetical protein